MKMHCSYRKEKGEENEIVHFSFGNASLGEIKVNEVSNPQLYFTGEMGVRP